MRTIKYVLFFTGILFVCAEDDVVHIPILGPVIGAVEGAVNSAADVVVEGEHTITRFGLADTIKSALKKFKTLMVDKIELLGLPRLEPLDINHIDINIKHEIGAFNGTMDDVKILNLSTFNTRDVNVHGLLPPWDVDLNLSFEKLVIYGIYDIDADVGGFIHVYGNGPFSLILHNIDTFVTLKKMGLGGKSIQFKDIGLKVKLGSLTSNFKNLMGGGDTEKLFNKVIEDIAPEAVDVLWPEIEPIISEKMKQIIRFSLIPNKFRRFVDGLHINLSPVTNLFGFNARFHFN